MPLPGGPADKFGNRYEGLWTVKCIIDILDEQADSIRLEPFGEEGKGVEFWLQIKDIRQYHQLKRQNTTGHWTITNLLNENILSNFRNKLEETSTYCYFISINDASQLRELSDRAIRSKDWTEFQTECLIANKLNKSFFELCQHWIKVQVKEIENSLEAIKNGKASFNDRIIEQSVIKTYELLKRVCVIIVGEEFLRQSVQNRLKALVEKKNLDFNNDEYANVVDILAQFALDKVHYELNALDIWNHLNQRGYQRREWGKNHHVLSAIDKANKIYLSRLQSSTIIPNSLILRDQVQTVLEALTNSNNKKGVLLVGKAGSGKSNILLQIVKELKDQSILLLAFSVDRLQPVYHPDSVGEQLKLPASPAIVLSNVAKSDKRDCILIIDQLDSVSRASGRNSQFFDCINDIIDQASQYYNVKLLLACRKFDLENDSRIKQLTGKDGLVQIIDIKPLRESEVKDIIEILGLDSRKLNKKQLDLLSLPLHLKLLSEIVENSEIKALNFKNENELFYQYWEHKQRKIQDILGYCIPWKQIINTLCKYMSDKQQQSLSAPKSILDQYLIKDVDVMISENVLIQEDNRIRFFHESFFDYAFARIFVSEEKSLYLFLLKGEQHLFKRAQVRQILLHQRENNLEQYLKDLHKLLTSSEIRFHIKKVTLALLSTFESPTPEEWQMIKSFAKDPNHSLNSHVWELLYSSSHNNSGRWFQLLDSLGEFEKSLKDDNLLPFEQIMILLSVAQRNSSTSARVAELLTPFINLSNEWNERLFRFIQRIPELNTSREFFDFFLCLIDEGILDSVQDRWQNLYSLSRNSPNWTAEAIGHHLNRLLILYLIRLIYLYSVYLRCITINIMYLNKFCGLNININPFVQNISRDNLGTINDTQYTQIFTENSGKASSDFINFVFPFIISVIELTVDNSNNPPLQALQDRVWGERTYGINYGIDNVLLVSMKIALCNLAKKSPEEFLDFIQQNLHCSQYETIQYLFICAYTANGKQFADEAIDYLCEQPERLRTGYAICGGNGDAAPYWATHELIQSVTAYCSNEHLTKLENLILNYYPEWEKSAQYLSIRGFAQLVLLDAIDVSRRSHQANIKLQEWQRKFSGNKLFGNPEKIEQPISMEAYLVGSPIPEEAANKMTDEQWLKAIIQYEYNNGATQFERTGKLVGGAIELSRELQKQVKKDPERFAKLINNFPNDINTVYFDAVLNGIAESDVKIDTQIVLNVCLRCHQLPQKPCGRSISWLFQKLAHLDWPISALDIVRHYALCDPDPENELWRIKATNTDFYYGADILTAGINSTRGSAVQAIAQLIFADKNRTAYLQGVLKLIVRDSVIAVRACVVDVLIAVLNYDRNLAIRLFFQLIQTEEELLGTNKVDTFLYYALPTHFLELQPILEQMIHSEILKVREIGAKRVFVVSLNNQDAQSLAQECLFGGVEHRQSAALVYASNLRFANFKQFCEKGLIDLFHDSDQKVRFEAARCFLEIKEEDLSNYINLIDKFIDSPAYKTYDYLITQSLYKQNGQLPEKINYKICKNFIDKIVKTRNTSESVNTQDISKLLIQIYSQSQNLQFQSDCLDLIDQMIQIRAYGLDTAIESYER